MKELETIKNLFDKFVEEAEDFLENQIYLKAYRNSDCYDEFIENLEKQGVEVDRDKAINEYHELNDRFKE